MDQSVYQLGTHLGTAVGIVVVVGIYVLAILALTCSVIWQKVVAAIGLGFHGQILGGCRRVCTRPPLALLGSSKFHLLTWLRL